MNSYKGFFNYGVNVRHSIFNDKEYLDIETEFNKEDEYCPNQRIFVSYDERKFEAIKVVLCKDSKNAESKIRLLDVSCDEFKFDFNKSFNLEEFFLNLQDKMQEKQGNCVKELYLECSKDLIKIDFKYGDYTL